MRDLLHVADLAALVEEQLTEPERWDGEVVNVGGGADCSLSLAETTVLCRELTGAEVPVSAEPEGRPGDVPIYVSDCTRLFERTDWRPSRTARDTLGDLAAWIDEHADELRDTLGFGVATAGRG